MATTVNPVHRVRAYTVHGILSAYPLAFFTAAFVADIAYARSAQMQWANFAAWLIVGGLFMGALAAVAGIAGALLYKGTRRRRSWPHSVVVLLMMVLAMFNVFIHSRDAWTSVVPSGLVLSAIVSLLALVTSWMGYSLEARKEDL